MHLPLARRPVRLLVGKNLLLDNHDEPAGLLDKRGGLLPAEIRKCVVVGLVLCRLRSGEDAPEVEGDGPLGGRRGFQSVTLTELGKVLPSPLVGLPGVFTEGRLAVLYCLSRKVLKLGAKCGLISPPSQIRHSRAE